MGAGFTECYRCGVIFSRLKAPRRPPPKTLERLKEQRPTQEVKTARPGGPGELLEQTLLNVPHRVKTQEILAWGVLSFGLLATYNAKPWND